jgi:hypothetical protein
VGARAAAARQEIKSWKGDPQDKETRYWVDALIGVDALMAQHAETTKPWFQLNRGGDCWAVLQTAIERSLLLTVRMVHNRRLVTSDGRTVYLRDHRQRQRRVGTYDMSVPARPGRAARVVHMSERTASVPLDLPVTRKRHVHVTLQACLAREKGGPKGDTLGRRKVLLGEMIALVAQEGGFAGPYSGRPPGAQVLARGLERITTLAKGLRNLEEMR